MTKRLLVILLFNVVLAAGLSLSIYQSVRRVQGEERMIQDVLCAECGEGATKANSALFGSADHYRLERLEDHANPTIALRAAWERVRRTVRQTGQVTIGPDPNELLRFKRFMEERFRIALPDWWAEGLLAARDYGPGYIGFNPYCG